MRKIPLLALMTALFALTFSANAQDDGVIADGLNNPRAVFYDAQGTLWIAEAGLAGDLTGDTENGPVAYGGSARVLKLEAGDDEAEVVMGGLPSASGFDDMIGVNSIAVDDNGLWLAIGLGPTADPFNMSIVNLDPDSLRVRHFIDLYTFEVEFNPDNDFPVSNPGDLATDGDGTYYIIDFSGNDLLKWTADGGLELIHAWEDLPVPTAVDIAPDGSLYVGFLSAFPFTQGSARVEHWSAAGELLETFDGLTGVTDVQVADDGTVYAVQLASEFGDLGWTGGSGSIVTVSGDGITPFAEGLNYPYGMAIAPDGSMVVTVNSTFSGEGNGQVIVVNSDGTFTAPVETESEDTGDDSEAEAPAETPEAPAETPEVPAETPEAEAAG
jgi:hypothetical protein